MGPPWGAHHETYTSVPHDGVQLPPTQGHDRDMGTTPNTAAIYVRRSAFDADNTEADAFSRSLAAQERECLAWAEHQGVCELGLLSGDESC